MQESHLYNAMERRIGYFSAMRGRMNVLKVDEDDPFYVAVVNVIAALRRVQHEAAVARRNAEKT